MMTHEYGTLIEMLAEYHSDPIPEDDENCIWRYDDWAEFWTTKCGEAHVFLADGPIENKYVYCPYCGRKIEVKE